MEADPLALESLRSAETIKDRKPNHPALSEFDDNAYSNVALNTIGKSHLNIQQMCNWNVYEACDCLYIKGLTTNIILKTKQYTIYLH